MVARATAELGNQRRMHNRPCAIVLQGWQKRTLPAFHPVKSEKLTILGKDMATTGIGMKIIADDMICRNCRAAKVTIASATVSCASMMKRALYWNYSKFLLGHALNREQ